MLNVSFISFTSVLFGLLVGFSGNASETAKQQNCDSNQQIYVFSWPLSDGCKDPSRGGSSKGAKTTVDPQDSSGWKALQQPNLSKFEKDRLAILAMQGAYRVDFNFLETVGFEANYHRSQPYHSWGTEYVYVLEDKPKFISLQHIMVMYFQQADGSVSAPMVMKHWRQDWRYQDRELLVYQGFNQWGKLKLPRKAVRGTWSQAVFQVDDSPRYEAIGKWQHNGSFSSWISELTARPLPRREASVRSDYQILEGYNRHTINRYGWVQEEENWKKALNKDGSLQSYLSKEEGVGRYRKIIGTDFTPGDAYMQKAGLFWADVRAVWAEIIDQRPSFQRIKPANQGPLFVPLFEYAQKVMDNGDYDSEAGKDFARKTINKYLGEIE